MSLIASYYTIVYKNDRITEHYILNDNKVDMVSMESLMTSDFDISPDRKTLKDFTGEYVLTEAKECSKNVKKPESEIGKQCWENMSACSTLMHKSDVNTLKQLCLDNIYATCEQWDSIAFAGDRIKSISRDNESGFTNATRARMDRYRC